MCYSGDSTEHLANDIAGPKMALRSRAALQQRAETWDDARIRELLELRAGRAHLRKISSRAKAEEQCDGGGEEHGVSISAAKVNRHSGDKLATTYACIAASSLTSHPSLAHSVSGAVELRAERTHLRNISDHAKAEEEVDSEIKEYEVAPSAAKVHGVLESNLSLIPAMPLLLSPHILLQRVLFLAQTRCFVGTRLIHAL